MAPTRTQSACAVRCQPAEGPAGRHAKADSRPDGDRICRTASYCEYARNSTRWSPVIILSHDCELEKDFNERVRELLKAVSSEAAAREEASRDPDLDPLAVAAPLLSYTELPESRHTGVRGGQRIGYFPLAAIPDAGPDDYAVDLFRVSTVDVLLLTTKLASLAEEAAGVLRYKLAEAYASPRHER